MAETNAVTLDLKFQGMSQAIATYLLRHESGAVLVECGPGSTTEMLEAGLASNGLSAQDVTHVLVTHIHLDHAGAAGWFAKQGAKVCVHPVGAPHLMDPAKLLRSARRIYGDQMDSLWGEIIPVPESSLIVPSDGEHIYIGNLHFLAIDVPGHAEHHFVYLIDDLCFTGDVGGIRIPGFPYLRIPMPPPELHLEKWEASIRRLRQLKFRRIAPTHFGIFEDADWHLHAMQRAIAETADWLEKVMRDEPDVEQLRERFLAWMKAESIRHDLSDDVIKSYDLANPLGMSADGLFRYWHKVRHPETT